MYRFLVATLFLAVLTKSVESGSNCPRSKNISPCYCLKAIGNTTQIICHEINETSSLERVTKSFKSMIVDSMVLLNTFQNGENQEDNEIFPEDVSTKMFPNKWLADLRVKHLDILGGNLHSCFLCMDALEGQGDFLTSLVVKNAGLKGHLCSTCASGSESVSTRELRRTPQLKTIDFSYNEITMMNGDSFPQSLIKLKKINLSNNQISIINDKALSNLREVEEVNLSRNQLTKISRKIFKDHDTHLRIIDFSYNSIEDLPVKLFDKMMALTEVSLAHNRLKTLHSVTWDGMTSNLNKIDLNGNFLVCNSTLNWMDRKFSRSTKLIAYCSAPEELELKDLSPKQLARQV